MLEARSIVYAKVDPSLIADVNRIMEGYEYLALVTTVDKAKGIIMLRGTPDTYDEIIEILENMPFFIEIQESFSISS